MKTDPFNELRKYSTVEEMPEGHLERFERKLDMELYPKRISAYLKYFAVAATLILLLGVSLLVYFSLQDFDGSRQKYSPQQPEMLEAELYYQSEIDARLEILSANPIVEKELIAELGTPDNALFQIKEDLYQNPDDSRLIHAVMESYQSRIEVLDRIIEQIEMYENQ
ncbi:MAG: hypothetical protein JW801_02800 [Bacteroidales bacterium]|nr:hypothetical protein [Bacteroidales bacterium]